MSESGEFVHRLALFQTGEFTLASGAKSSWKIECDALTDHDWDALAVMLVERLDPFSFAYGVPRGGIPLADALNKYRDGAAQRTVVVDDVWTTGGSMGRFIRDLSQSASWSPLRAVVFARRPPPPGVTALFVMPHNGGPR